MTESILSPLDFDHLAGWTADDHAAALQAFRITCADLDGSYWREVCAGAFADPDPQRFFETQFRPVLIEDGKPALFTGYYEPELQGARAEDELHRHPVYAMPTEAQEIRPWLSRRDLLESGRLQDRGLEIAWVDDPVALFFLQIQGSGRIRLADGGMLRVGYAGTNGHPYRSIGAELVRRGVYTAEEMSADAIKKWLHDNPEAGRDLMFHNPSFVFFREVHDLPPQEGPLGAMNRSVTPMRSIAVDPAFVPLGAPVWIELDGSTPVQRLMIAQDTGSAIKGAQRADLFFGTGDAAGRAAGQLRDPGRMVVLLPHRLADALLSGDVP